MYLKAALKSFDSNIKFEQAQFDGAEKYVKYAADSYVMD